MARRLRSKLTFSNVVSLIALFVAVGGGTAFALQGKNSVRSDDIAKGQVKTADIARNAVTGPKVRNGAIGSGDLSPAIRPVRFSYSRPIGTAAQETVLDAGGLRIQAACEDNGGRPRIRAFLIASQPGVLDVFGSHTSGGTTQAVEGTLPLEAGVPVSLADTTPGAGARSGSGAVVSYSLGGPAGNLVVHTDANDANDTCAMRGTLLPLG